MSEFLIDKKQLRRAFSRAAAQYDAAAVLQREVCNRMLEKLDCVKLQPSSILDAGCGTGWGTRQLVQRYPAARMVALDMALGMLELTREQGGWWRKLLGGGRQVQVCADIEALPLAAGSMDMVWSNLTLQWCNVLPDALRGLHRVLRKDGLLMFSTFGPDTLHELRSAFSGVDGHSHVNRFFDMHDIGDMLVAAGFGDPVMEMEKLTLTYNDVKGVMQDLRSIGANNATAGRAQGMMGKAAWRRVVENYERFRCDGKLPATFEIIYGHAWKPEPRVTEDGAQIIRTPFRL
jgi:malonyl-CoA O-methyltransferase